jgi:predicted exporter
VLIALIPASAALMVIGGLSIAGQEISLFHLFGLYLIIGLGLDYGIFIFRNQHDDARCFVAIFLSAVTTVFAFGLLSQSSTPMISAFGVTIFFGTVLNILLAPGLRLFATRRDGA